MSKAAELAALIGSQTALSNRNLVINGAMQVAQRATSASAKSSAGYHVVDRFRFVNNTSTGAVDIEQSTTVPAGQGFGSSLKVSTSTAKATLTGTNEFGIQQRIEGQNLQSLNYGTSSASKSTLSFWVRSNKTGTYVVWLYQTGNNRNIQKQFTISSADTWEKKELTIDGDTSGSLANDNSNELEFFIVLGTGPDRSSGTAPTTWQTLDNADRYVGQTVNILDSTSNNFYLTGVQLEVGEQATPFEHRSYADELTRCQRYFTYVCSYSDNARVIGPAHYKSSTQVRVFAQTPVVMRARGSITEKTSGGMTYRFNHTGGNENNDGSTTPVFDNDDQPQLTFALSGFSGLSSSDNGVVKVEGSGNYLAMDAEL